MLVPSEILVSLEDNVQLPLDVYTTNYSIFDDLVNTTFTTLRGRCAFSFYHSVIPCT